MQTIPITTNVLAQKPVKAHYEEQKFVFVPNCYGFMQKRIAGESTHIGRFNPDKEMKQEEVLMPEQQVTKNASE